MGGSNSKSESDTIHWNNLKTENMTANIPNLNGLSYEAKQLISKLNIPEITESETSEAMVDNIMNKIHSGLNQEDRAKFDQLVEQLSENDLSATSPFISSEMYNSMINSKTSEDMPQQGGAKKTHTKSKNGGSSLMGDDSDTSSTSSDSDITEILDTPEEEYLKKDKKDKKKDKKKKKFEKEDLESEFSGGAEDLSYISSSAHTGGDLSENESDSETQDSQNSTVTDENKMQRTSVSVDTDDINMVSDY
jgi:hypothetical protein